MLPFNALSMEIIRVVFVHLGKQEDILGVLREPDTVRQNHCQQPAFPSVLSLGLLFILW